MNQQPRVPIVLREKVFLICSVPPFSYAGRACYASIARIVACSLKNFSASAEVFLRGKHASKSIPGLSDLDFWIFLPDKDLIQPQKLIELREIFSKLNKRYILPVKLEVTSWEGWKQAEFVSPASFLQDTPLIKFSASGWVKQDLNPEHQIRALSRFNLCFFEYKSAQACLNKLSENESYTKAVFNKHLKKLTEFAGSPQAEVSAASALIILDQAAALAAIEKNNVAGIRIKRGSDCKSIPQNIFSERFSEAGFTVLHNQIADLLIWEVDQPDLESTERILSVFDDLAADKKTPMLVTRQIWSCLWRGAVAGPLLENLDYILSEQGEESQSCLASDLYLFFRDRLVTRINHNLGVLVSYKTREFLAPLLYQCFEILIVNSRLITKDLGLLCSLSEKDCPLTVKWINRLADQKIPADMQEWAQVFVGIRAEALRVIERAMAD